MAAFDRLELQRARRRAPGLHFEPAIQGRNIVISQQGIVKPGMDGAAVATSPKDRTATRG
jgi:hypothetical protein